MNKTFKSYICYILTLFGMSVLMVIYIIQMTTINGNSMEPELTDGQRILVNKLLYRKKEPERFDVIVFSCLYGENEYYVKRIVGLPGETVQIIDKAVYINGEKLKDSFGNAPMEQAGLAGEAIILGEDEYFVLGDNRNLSSDSRTSSIGNVRRKQIFGKAIIKLWPIKRIL